MSTLHNCLLLSAACTFFALSTNAQTSLASQNGTAYRPAKEANEATPVYHFHKKLPALYEGYAIEVATSTYPLNPDNPIFRKFGNIHYDKLERGGYSYLIPGRFSNDKSALHFLNNVIVPQVKDARVIRYKDGIRRIVRAD